MVRRFTDIPSLLLAGLVMSGYFKAAVNIPVDLTILLAMAVVLACGLQLILNQWRISKKALGVLSIFALLAVPLLWSPMDTAYGAEKALRLFTMTLLVTIAPILLARSNNAPRFVINAFAVVGAVMAVGALTVGVPKSEYEGAATTVFGSNSISLGRSTALTCLVCVLALLWRRPHRGITLWVLAVSLVALLSSGSRGPLGAMLLTLVVLLSLKSRGRGRWVRHAAVAGVLVAGVAFAFYSAPELARARIELVVEGGTDNSINERSALYRESLDLALTNPQGLGWGGFAQETARPRALYPHNLLLEVIVEAGWIIGAIFLSLLWRNWDLSRRDAWTHDGQLVFTILTYTLLISLVSGDLPDNRLLFVSAGIAAAAQIKRAPRSLQQPAEVQRPGRMSLPSG